MDLGEWADKLESAMAGATVVKPMANRLFGIAGAAQPVAMAPAIAHAGAVFGETQAHRYVRGIR